MSSPFPPESVKHVFEMAERARKDYPKRTKFQLLAGTVHNFTRDDTAYGFRDHLHTGLYAPYPHEMGKESRVFTFNCTTVIPSIYLIAEAYGCRPEIIQFKGFRNRKKEKDTENPKDPANHFSLRVYHPEKNKAYLVDVFHSIFGQILEEGQGWMRIGRGRNFDAVKREFDEYDVCTPEAFVAMMDRLHEPGPSLDMLIAGQKLGIRTFQHIRCPEHVYFNEDKAEIQTRLYIPRELIRDLAMFIRQKVTPEGEIAGTEVDLYSAKDRLWAMLVDPKHIATADLRAMDRIRREVNSVYKAKKDGRLGPVVMKKQNRDLVRRLEECTKYGEELKTQVYARTLYETEEPSKRYLYTPEEQDTFLFAQHDRSLVLQRKNKKIEDKLWRVNSRWDKMSRNVKKRMRRKNERIDKQITEISEKNNFLNYLRYHNRSLYCAIIEKHMYAERLEGMSAEDLEAEVRKRGVDPNIGHMAMVVDFFPFLEEARKELLLTNFMPSILGKVKARYAQEAEKRSA